jgi:hypothetical protein
MTKHQFVNEFDWKWLYIDLTLQKVDQLHGFSLTMNEF